MKKVPTGSEVLDELLNGGYPANRITMIYGPAASGKTTACLQLCVNNSLKRSKTLFLDTEKGFSVERLQQISSRRKCLNDVLIVNVGSFQELIKKVKKSYSLLENAGVNIMVIDTIGKHYRVSLNENPQAANKKMVELMRLLHDITTKRELATVLITNQVYTDIENDRISNVGGKMIRNFSTCVIELKKDNSKRIAKVVKYDEAELKELEFLITNIGISKK
ncbi:AAA family ATPase [Candidatus Woesearchaeota archaeon]|nr:MAG: AAA family ATPase [Candidatus Woesearchaeota archaeon]